MSGCKKFKTVETKSLFSKKIINNHQNRQLQCLSIGSAKSEWQSTSFVRQMTFRKMNVSKCLTWSTLRPNVMSRNALRRTARLTRAGKTKKMKSQMWWMSVLIQKARLIQKASTTCTVKLSSIPIANREISEVSTSLRHVVAKRLCTVRDLY